MYGCYTTVPANKVFNRVINISPIFGGAGYGVRQFSNFSFVEYYVQVCIEPPGIMMNRILIYINIYIYIYIYKGWG